MRMITNARWKLRVDTETNRTVAEFIVETEANEVLCKMIMTKKALWELAKASMDTADYLNDLEEI